MMICEMTKCEAPATVAHWDCCEGWEHFCSDHNWNGGTTEHCDWEVQDLDGNILATNI